jgi:predicted HAD superfamily Cof-like phosphohydrolase
MKTPEEWAGDIAETRSNFSSVTMPQLLTELVRQIQREAFAAGEKSATKNPVKSLRSQLVEFSEAFGYTANSSPTIPGDDVVRLRARVIIEEAFEALESMFDTDWQARLATIKDTAKEMCAKAGVDVDAVALADALGDTDYVVEGTRLAFGIDGTPVAAEIHRSNMAKVGGVKDKHGKIQKPAGWTPPDIGGELRKQGWKG